MTEMAAAAELDRSWWDEMQAGYGELPIHTALGLSLEVLEAGAVRVRYDGTPAAGNRRGIAAGGALAEMINSAVVQACRTKLGREVGTVTLELKVNFIRAAPAGSALVTTGKIEHLGRTTAVGHGRTEDDSGRLIALGMVTVALLRAKAG